METITTDTCNRTSKRININSNPIRINHIENEKPKYSTIPLALHHPLTHYARGYGGVCQCGAHKQSHLALVDFSCSKKKTEKTPNHFQYSSFVTSIVHRRKTIDHFHWNVEWHVFRWIYKHKNLALVKCRTEDVPNKNTKLSIFAWKTQILRKIFGYIDAVMGNRSFAPWIFNWFSLNSPMIDDKNWEFGNSCTYPLWSTNRERTQRKFVSCHFVSAYGSLVWYDVWLLNICCQRKCARAVVCGHSGNTSFACDV